MKMPLTLIWVSDDIPELAALKKKISTAAGLSKAAQTKKWQELTENQKTDLMIEHYSEDQLKVITVEDLDKSVEEKVAADPIEDLLNDIEG